MNINRNGKILDYIKNSLENIVITGPNMSGKSKLMHEILVNKNGQEIYFISSNNRVINEKVRSERLEIALDLNVINILNNRIEFLEQGIDKDILGRGSGEIVSELVSELFILFYADKDFREKFEDFMQTFKMKIIIENEVRIKAKIKGLDVNLSTGLKAMIRIFTEVWLAKKIGVTKIFIDEIDMHIDQKNSREFVEKLFKTFSGIKFVCIVHNISAIAGLTDTTIISLENEDEALTFDSNEYEDIKAIASDIFGVSSVKKKEKNSLEKNIEKLEKALYDNGKLSLKEIEEYKRYRLEKNISPKYRDILDIIGEILEDTYED